ncbi:MAG: MarR family transcriptional regulator [Alphaproteobacteria bacterium]|nr:MarR family transcriptional regulator [Alphaproteobacteria bacterium SS10]
MNGWKTEDGSSLAGMASGDTVERSADTSASHQMGATHDSSGASPMSDADLLGEFSLDDEVGFLVRRVHQRVTALFQERMRDHDLTPTQFSSLCKMAETGEVSQNQLGRLVNLDPATNQGVVRRLQKRGLIQRRDDPNDRRRSLLTLTDTGREVLTACLPAASRITPSVLKPLNSEERVLLMDMLRRLG